jgi:hypothetical protein
MLSPKQIKNLENESFFIEYKKIKTELVNLKESKINNILLSSSIFLSIFSSSIFLLKLNFDISDINLLTYIILHSTILIFSAFSSSLLSEIISTFINKHQKMGKITKYMHKCVHKLFNYNEVEKCNKQLEDISEEIIILLSTPYSLDSINENTSDLKRYLLINIIEKSSFKEFELIKSDIIAAAADLNETNIVNVYKAVEDKVIENNKLTNKKSEDILNNINIMEKNAVRKMTRKAVVKVI